MLTTRWAVFLQNKGKLGIINPKHNLCASIGSYTTRWFRWFHSWLMKPLVEPTEPTRGVRPLDAHRVVFLVNIYTVENMFL